MLYAIVDIETTGGHPNTNRITEIAINIHDGELIVGTFHTLINPQRPIPIHITALTGIDDEMVQHAPTFSKVAQKIFELLDDKIFVAHNVNFDFSFLKHELALNGYDLKSKKLCTVRLSRKLIPNLSSYSLGKLCRSLNIPLEDRHRAFGDANATSILFNKLLSLDQAEVIPEMLKKGSKEYTLPPHVNKVTVTNLPNCAGVYYFLDNKGKVIYVGKALSVKKRVLSHFTGHSASKQRQDFLRNIYHVDYTICGTELMALILESAEIKRLWPENNRAQKRYEHKFGVFDYLDQNGYIRLGVDKIRGNISPILAVNNLLDGKNFINQMVTQFGLCPRLSGSVQSMNFCNDPSAVCSCSTEPTIYNQKVEAVLEEIAATKPNFVLVDKGRNEEENSVILVENGKFMGMGYTDQLSTGSVAELKNALQPYPSNSYILNLILKYADKHPYKVKLIA